MDFFANMSPRGRRSALAVGMLAVLLLSTAAAWLITLGRSGARPGEQWYLIRGVDGTPVGWEVFQRDADDRQGYHIVGGRQSPPLASRWRLDADPTVGRYVSSVPIAANRRGVVYQVTAIGYDGKTVKLRQYNAVGAARGQVRTVLQWVDDSYIPEGRLREVVAEVARSGEQVLRTIVNDDQLQVVPMTLSPGEDVQRVVGGTARTLTPVEVAYELKATDGPSSRYYVAADGSILLQEQITGDAVTGIVELLTGEAVTDSFPSAPAERTRALRALDWD